MFDFVPNNRHLREVLNSFFHSKKTATEAHQEFQKVYGDTVLSERTYRDWFRRFKDGDFDLMLTTVRMKEGQKPSKTLDWKYCSNETITCEKYRIKFMRMSRTLREKRPQYEQRHKKVSRS